jgi:hypothetical protein
MASNSRYIGKPLLRLFECYVLWAIGKLTDQEAATLQAMTPKLQSIYSHDGDWPDIIAAVGDFPENMPELIRDMWVKNYEIARQNKATLSPQHFAEMFVDDNLLPEEGF